MIRAFQREKVPFRATLQPNGAAIFEPPISSGKANCLRTTSWGDLAEDL